MNCEKCGMRTDIKGMDSCFCGPPGWKPYEPYTPGLLSTYVCAYVHGSGGTCVEKVKKAGDRCCEEHKAAECQHLSGSYDEDGNEVCDRCNLMVYESTEDEIRMTIPWRPIDGLVKDHVKIKAAFENHLIGIPWMNPKEEFFGEIEKDLSKLAACQVCDKAATVWAKDIHYSPKDLKPTMGGYSAACGDCYFDWWNLIDTSIQDPDLLALQGWGQTISMWETSVSPEERQRAAILDPAFSYELRTNKDLMAPYFGDRIIGPSGEALIVRNVYLHRSDLSGPYLALECSTGEIFGAADCELRGRALPREARPPFDTPGIMNATRLLTCDWMKEARKDILPVPEGPVGSEINIKPESAEYSNEWTEKVLEAMAVIEKHGMTYDRRQHDALLTEAQVGDLVGSIIPKIVKRLSERRPLEVSETQDLFHIVSNALLAAAPENDPS